MFKILHPISCFNLFDRFDKIVIDRGGNISDKSRRLLGSETEGIKNWEQIGTLGVLTGLCCLKTMAYMVVGLKA